MLGYHDLTVLVESPALDLLRLLRDAAGVRASSGDAAELGVLAWSSHFVLFFSVVTSPALQLARLGNAAGVLTTSGDAAELGVLV
jgi:hypothetical protein